MAKTVADIISEAADRFDDPTHRRFSEATLRSWILEGSKDIARRTECLRGSAAIAVSASTQEVTGPVDTVRIHDAQFEPTGQTAKYPLTYLDRKAMHPLWGAGQSQGTGTPEYYTTWGVPPTLTITLAPIPSEAGTLRVFYYRLPATIATDGTDDSDPIDLPAGWEDLVTTYVEARGYRKDRRLDDYQLAMGDYRDQLRDLMLTSARFIDEPGSFIPSEGWVGYATGW
jgi:hypothetical protein